MGLDDQAVIELCIRILLPAYLCQQLCSCCIFIPRLFCCKSTAEWKDYKVEDQGDQNSSDYICQADCQHFSHTVPSKDIGKDGGAQSTNGGTGESAGIVCKVKGKVSG